MKTKAAALLLSLAFLLPPPASAEGPKTGILGMGAISGNAPTGEAAIQGGIAANQMAAHNNALDLLLAEAIRANNPDGARSALQGGVSLALDHKAACPLPKSPGGRGLVADLSNPDHMKLLMRGLLFAAPAACEKLHMLSALEAVAGLDRYNLPRAAYEAEVRGLAPQMADYDAAREKYRAAREVLALIDANTPAADKAYYPLYLAAVSPATPVSPDVFLWVMRRYESALPEIKRARAARDPLRERWAKIGADAYAGNGVLFASLWDKSAVAEGNIPAGTDPDAMVWLFALDIASSAYGRPLAGAERARCDASRPEEKAVAEAALPRVSDFSASPPAAFSAALPAIAAVPGANVSAVEGAYRRVSSARLLGYLLEKAKTGGVLSVPYAATQPQRPGIYRQDGQYGGSARVETYLHSLARNNTGGRYSVPGALARAALEAGANPNAMDPAGKTPLDIVLAASAGRENAVKQAFLKKDFGSIECPAK